MNQTVPERESRSGELRTSELLLGYALVCGLALLLAVLAGCGGGEQASTVTIAPSQQAAWPFPAASSEKDAR